MRGTGPAAHEAESPYAWTRLVVSVILMTIGGSGMYGVTVVLPIIQAEFSVARSSASLPYAVTMVGFGLGGIVMGRLSDRFGAMYPVLLGAIGLGCGYVAAGMAENLWQFSLAQGLLIGFLGTSATFAPLVADVSHWFTRRRGIAVAICASGNYIAGAFWPPVMQHFFESAGWRETYIAIGVFSMITALALAWMLRPRRPALRWDAGAGHALAAKGSATSRPLGMTPAALQALLCTAGVGCCVAMSMPQVHIVAYCGDLGYAAARGAEMLSLMLGFGILSRLVSGWLSDRIGGVRTLLLNSVLQCTALLMFVPSEGLVALYAASALFGLFQGGLIPSYALIVREYFPAQEAGVRTAVVLTATLFGMALGGWLAGAIFDMTGSYRYSFYNAIAWNLLNMSIAFFLLRRSRFEATAGERMSVVH